MAKFYFFEKIVQLFYTHVFTKPKSEYSKPTQLGVTFASGYLAGVVCAIVSHPADSLVSQMGKQANKGKSVSQIASEVGLANLATKGLGTRVIMIGTLTGVCSRSRFDCGICAECYFFQASNGGSTTRSRPLWVWARRVASRLYADCTHRKRSRRLFTCFSYVLLFMTYISFLPSAAPASIDFSFPLILLVRLARHCVAFSLRSR